MNKYAKLTRITSVIFLMLFFTDQVVTRFVKGVEFNYEFLTPIQSGLFLFSLFGLSSYLFLMIVSEHQGLRILMSLFAFLSLFTLSFFALWSSENVKTVQYESHTIYIKEYRFLFDGSDTIYVKDNLLFSTYVGSYDQHEDASSSYEYREGILTVTTTWYNGHQDVFEIDLSKE